MGKESLHNTDMLESSEDFETAYETYANDVYRFMLWRTQNNELSQDLTSHVFEKAWRARTSFQGGSVKAWLYRIARNTLVDHWRKKQELIVEDTDTLQENIVNDDTAEALDKEAELQKLRQAIAGLPTEMRAVVKLRFISNLSSREVAKQLHMSEGNVRVIQYRALKKLRERLK